ncbi:hypothetical protein ACIPSJ_43445 [Streptomyces sp. NPDC090088]|uniref:hypothetical protein n=1 Tax=Streptomyces sp. NPDC090088 TaxID=3365944 RepID=UPI00380B207F
MNGNVRLVVGTATLIDTAGRRAFETGDLQGLLGVLAPDVVFVSDKVLRYMAGSVDKAGGNPGLLLRVENARVAGLRYVRNPERLTRVESEPPPLPLTREKQPLSPPVRTDPVRNPAGQSVGRGARRWARCSSSSSSTSVSIG